MPKVKNVTAHVDTLHDGRPLPAYATADITPEDLELAHYQTRIDDGLLITVTPEEAVEPPEPEEAEPKPKRPRQRANKQEEK